MNSDELIDRFATNLSDSSNFSSVEVHTGVFGFAEIELSFERVCAENFYGPRCEVFCVENCDVDCERVNCNNGTCIQGIASITCVCEPGFTGTDCSTDINECEGVNCNNGTCIQGIASNTCVCEPGFTGTDCSTDINECEGVDCNSGVCMDDINTFTCVCDVDATGELCMIRVTDSPPQSPALSQMLIAAIAAPVSAVCFCLLIVTVVVLASLYLQRRKDNSQHMHYDTDGFPLAVRHTTTGNCEGSNVTTHENTSTTTPASIREKVSFLHCLIAERLSVRRIIV